MLHAFRIRFPWRATLRVFVIFCVGLPGTVVKSAEISLLSKVHSAARSAAKFVLQQSSSQQRLPGQTAPKTAALQGIVRDREGKAIIAAHIILRNEGTQQVLERDSDAQGVFRIVGVPPGAYQLEVHATGYQDLASLEMQLKAEATPPPRAQQTHRVFYAATSSRF